jgi:CHAD domain-containing protein
MAKTSSSSQAKAAQPYGVAMQTLIADRFDTLWKAEPAARAGDDPEGVHQMRVASRRLRAAMDVAADVYPKKWFARLQKSVKQMTDVLGDVRDCDVQLEALRAQRESAPPRERAGIDRLIEHRERDREAARERLTRFLDDLDARGIPDQAARRFGAEKPVADGAVESTEPTKENQDDQGTETPVESESEVTS